MKRFGKALIVVLILIALFHAVIYVVNNHIAKQLESELLNCPLPPNSELIDSVSVAGKMEGNGNGMQWFGIILIRSEKNEVDLLQWYNSHEKTDVSDEIYVIRQKSPEVFEFRNYHFNNFSGEDLCYQIQLFRDSAVGTESSIWKSLLNFDLRGH